LIRFCPPIRCDDSEVFVKIIFQVFLHIDAYNIYEYEVFLLLTSIKKTSPEPDKLPYWFFRYAAADLTPVITDLIRLTLSNGTPPEAWKRAVVTPVPKVVSMNALNINFFLLPIKFLPLLNLLICTA